ncbi:hypothetical protein ALC53_03287 [Atta colombica]|uniref:CHK kinase-like domain-containing protein n=1 Tax=Atta colombica TaxID=520822 RepID=A0A195BNQ4_9HYME|nr:hypothetical protein ALC53_03287 [Atta colombica]
MKELQCEKFFDIMKQIQEIRYDEKYEWKNFINLIATRAVEYLRNHGHDVTCDKMEALLSQVFDKVMMKIVESREPLSTLCHGDFTSSNILFKTENEVGVSNIEKYSYKTLLDDYRRGGLFDLFIASFFLPVVRAYYIIDSKQLAYMRFVDYGNVLK